MGRTPRRQIAAIYVKSPSLYATPKCHFSRAGGFPKAPIPVPPVCSPFADAFQRPLTAHEKPGLCVLYLPATGAFQFSAP